MNVKAALIALALAGAFAKPLHAEVASPVLPGNPLEGSRLFAEKGCLRCHAINGVGGVGGPDLGQGILKRSLLDIAGVMWNHSPGMAHLLAERRAARPLFKPPEMASLLSFLYYIGSLDPPGDAAAGERVFREKSCRTCHSLGGKGGRYGPRLDGYARYASPIYLTVGLWNHGKAMAGIMQALGIPRPTFEKNDIVDLFAYIRSVGGSVERVYLQPGSPQRGEKLFSEKRCIQCHSVDGQGGRIGPNLRGRLKGSLMRIAGAMWNHGPGMWKKMAERGIQVPSLTADEMSDLVSYLYFVQFVDAPGTAARGRVVFQEKKCANCHGSADRKRARAAVDLAKAETLATPLAVVTEMWNHASTMERKMLEEAVEWPVFRGREMADLIAYLLSLRATP
ncbi:MAG TPA: c-type cytochrome [candidate division Zixibacteria bacterium]|nr:c-type cytochrome [candidate division Zixibacteria bacterium]